MKRDSDFLCSVATAGASITVGICLIVSDDNGGIVYTLFGILLLFLEIVSERRYTDKLERELTEERRQQRTIIVRVGKDEEKRTTD